MIMMATRGKTWPNRKQLLAWFIYDKLETLPIGEFDNPDNMLNWLEEFERIPLIDTHDRLYSQYSGFVERFLDPISTPSSGT